MKKRLFYGLTIFALIFAINSKNIVFAESITSEEQILLEESIGDLELDFENIINPSDEDLEQYIDEAIEFEEMQTSVYGARRLYGIDSVFDVIERQYNLKKSFVLNTRDVYNLSRDIQKNVKYINSEVKYIVKDDSRNIDRDDLYDLLDNISDLKVEMKNNEYVAGDIGKTSVRYTKQIKNKDFRNAKLTFIELVELQEEQIQLLKVLLAHTENTIQILENI